MASSTIFCSAVLLFVLFYIRHYPVTGSLLSLFLLRTMIDAKVEKIIVKEDRFVVVTRRLFPFLTKKQVVLFSTVESIQIPQGKGETFLVRYKDGDHRHLSPSIRRVQFEKAVGVIGSLSLILRVRRGSWQEA